VLLFSLFEAKESFSCIKKQEKKSFQISYLLVKSMYKSDNENNI